MQSHQPQVQLHAGLHSRPGGAGGAAQVQGARARGAGQHGDQATQQQELRSCEVNIGAELDICQINFLLSLVMDLLNILGNIMV